MMADPEEEQEAELAARLTDPGPDDTNADWACLAQSIFDDCEMAEHE